MQPRHQPTVATDKSTRTWVVVAAIAGAVAAWVVQGMWGEREQAVASVTAPPAPSTPSQEPAAEAEPPAPVAAQAAPTAVAPEAAPADTISIRPVETAPRASSDLATPAMDACDQAIARSGMHLPEDFRVLAAGAYEGRKLGYRIDQSGHEATQIDVVVSIQDKPVALMLGAYEPTVWNLSWTSGTRIVAVYVGGYHAQRLAGLPKNIPLLISSYEEKGGCPYFYLGGEGMQTLNPAARRVFGRPADMAYPVDRDGTIFITTSGAVRGVGPASTARAASARRNYGLPPGEAGLDQAIQLGVLRRAGPADSELWSKVMAQRGRGDAPPIAGQAGRSPPPPPPRNVFVVQGDFTFPEGLTGAHSVVFVVPPGAPVPAGSPGHSAVYTLH